MEGVGRSNDMQADFQDKLVEAGRAEQFMRLLLAHERRIYGFILALVRDWSDADDLMQETSAVMWRKFDEFEPGTHFVAWALSVARYQVLNHQKKQRVKRSHLSEQNVQAIAERMASDEKPVGPQQEALDLCMRKLPERDRELIRLRYEHGATTQDVADRAGRSIHAVYKALNRIHAKLLECIRQAMASGDVA